MPNYDRKPDAARISAKLKALQQLPSLGTRNWWPLHLYHFAEFQNAVSILEAGSLACRASNLMRVDTASPLVIGNTVEEWKAYARFYFRPRTPTQYQVEGFRPIGEFGSLGKHCPMPFIFMFGAEEVLTRQTTAFSTGNIGVGTPSIGYDADFFENLPFELIYHEGPMPADNKSSIKYHRCAEALVPDSLGLDALRYICCRSDAEYQTLWNSLTPATRTKFQNRFTVGANPHVHFRYWTFVESVTLEAGMITFRFNPSTLKPGPFHAEISITGPKIGTRNWKSEAFQSQPVFRIRILDPDETANYTVTLELNGDLAYRGVFQVGESGIVGLPKR